MPSRPSSSTACSLPAARPARRRSSASASAAPPTWRGAGQERGDAPARQRAVTTPTARALEVAALVGRQPARRRPAGPRRRFDRVRGSRRARRDAHHDEPGRGEHAVSFGAARVGDDRRGWRALRVLDAGRSIAHSRMAHHDLTPPISEAQVRALRVDDTVTLQGLLFGIRDATQIAHVRPRPPTRFDLAGHAVIHTAPNVRKVERSRGAPGGLRAAVRRHDDVGAHGALHATADGAMRRAPDHRQGRIARRFAGGLRRARRRVPGDHRRHGGAGDDLDRSRSRTSTSTSSTPRALWRFRIRDFGPLTVAMDSHGGSLYAAVDACRAIAPRRRAGRTWGQTLTWPKLDLARAPGRDRHPDPRRGRRRICSPRCTRTRPIRSCRSPSP